jgi:hypothetical protein
MGKLIKFEREGGIPVWFLKNIETPDQSSPGKLFDNINNPKGINLVTLCLSCSVADPGGFIPDPTIAPSRIRIRPIFV